MKLFVPLTIIFSIYIGTSFAITFDMPPKSMKCFLETYPKDQLVKGKVEFNDQILRLRFWVEDENQRLVFGKKDIESGDYSFNTLKDGSYRYCFVMEPRNEELPIMGDHSRRIIFTSSSIHHHDNSQEILLASLKPLEAKLTMMEAIARQVEKESWILRSRFASHQVTSENLNSKVSWLSIVTVLCLVATGVSQVFYIGRYLKKSKYID